MAASAATSVTTLVGLTSQAVSPIRGSAMSPKAVTCSDSIGYIPEFRSQLCSRILWTYLILGLVLLAVCFYFFASAKADVAQYIGTRPDSMSAFVDNPWFIYITVSIVGVLYVYGMYRAYIACENDSTRTMLNVAFAVIVALIIIWFYQFYRNGKLNAQPQSHNTGGTDEYGNRTPFFIAVAILVLLVVQVFLVWKADYVAAICFCILIILIALFAWQSWELSTGATQDAF